MRPSKALERYRDQMLAVIARYPVSNPRVFGSVARGEDVEGSDVDILVDRDGNLSLFDLAKLEIELERILGVPIGRAHARGIWPSGLKADRCRPAASLNGARIALARRAVGRHHQLGERIPPLVEGLDYDYRTDMTVST